MEVFANLEGSSLVINLVGELDECTVAFAQKQVDSFIEEQSIEFDSVVFDLSQLSFMDSTGLNFFLCRWKLARDLSKKVYVRKPSAIANKMFEMWGLYDLMIKL